MLGVEAGCCLAPWGPCWGGQRGTVPSSGLARATHRHPLSHPGRGLGSREELGGGVLQVVGDGEVLLTQVGMWLAAGVVGKHTCPGKGELPGGCFGIPGRIG